MCRWCSLSHEPRGLLQSPCVLHTRAVGVLSQEVLRKQLCALAPRRTSLSGWCTRAPSRVRLRISRSLRPACRISCVQPAWCSPFSPPASPASLPFSPLPNLVSCLLHHLSYKELIYCTPRQVLCFLLPPSPKKFKVFDSCCTGCITVSLTRFYLTSLVNKTDWKVWVLGRLCDFS